MKIQLKEITVRDLVEGYQDLQENGVVGYGGRLDIRPPYQREFVYKDKQRDAVIDTLTKNFPLNVMYWAVRSDGGYEVIDGQQRTISICQYVTGEFSHRFSDHQMYFHNLQDDQKEQILNYKLMIYLCEGENSEKLEWFKTINIAGEKLTEQELRNAVFSGSWVSDAKRYFSKTNCPAYQIGEKYISGSPIRQDYLETVIKWISLDHIEKYMGKHQHKLNAEGLWKYYEAVISWVRETFPKYRKEMKKVNWGFLYNDFKDKSLDSVKLEEEITKLMQDEDVTNKKGIYEYVLTRDERCLSIRAFTDNQKREAYERQEGMCLECGKKYEFSEMEADHITPWHEGGKTIAENCQMLCKLDNRQKGGK